MANATVRVGRAAFGASGLSLIDRIGGRTLCAKRIEESRGRPNVLFRMLNRLNEWMNDMTLLPPNTRPPVVPIETWAPLVMVELPPGLADRLTNLSGYEHTPYLKDAARRALGPDGGYRIRARYSGKIESFAPARRHRHVLQIRVGEQIQCLPATATLLDHLDVGSEVAVGEPIADFCPRIQLANWLEVRDFLDVGTAGEPIDLGVADWIYLPDFLAQEVIRPGSNGWNGPGDLIDARYLPAAMVQRGWRRYLDF
jgi:hypothetical protein